MLLVVNFIKNQLQIARVGPVFLALHHEFPLHNQSLVPSGKCSEDLHLLNDLSKMVNNLYLSVDRHCFSKKKLSVLESRIKLWLLGGVLF
uniref:Uncharacterized protein MANES_01G047500 n=1 Tax=Rhizophora mucronata TaxID=61149 RepID=A0A2P2LL97_RHIMU